jgi:hypothetical protein
MWADASLLSQLPNGGAVVAIICVVILFLKRAERSEEMIRSVVDSFTAETSASRAEYREHVGEIMRLGLTAHAETREAIRALTDTLRGIGENPK